MKQSELKALCREYLTGAISDAKLLSQLQMGDHMRDLLNGVCALPTTAQMRVRIEDLLPVTHEPARTGRKIKRIEPSTYMQRLHKFVDDHYDDGDDVLPWTNPEITTGTAINGHDRYYRFSFKTKNLARAFCDALRFGQPSKTDREKIKLDEANSVVISYVAQLESLNLVPSEIEVTELL